MAIEEKSVSKAQQRFFGMVDAYKKGEMPDASPAIKKAAKGMTKKQVKDFAKTKHKGLPNHVDEFKISKKNIMLKEDGPMAAAPMGPAAAGAAPAGDPNAMMGGTPMAPAQNTPSTIDIARQKGNESMRKVVQAYKPSGKTEDNNTNNNNNQAQQANNTQGQHVDATAANQAPAPVSESLTESDLKYISRKAISILREWTK